MTYNQLLEMIQQNEEKYRDKDLSNIKLKMEMNIRMYEPNLIRYLDNLESEIRELNKIRFAIEDRWKKTNQASELFQPLNKQLEKVGAVNDALIAAIVERGVSIGSEKSSLLQLGEAVVGMIRPT